MSAATLLAEVEVALSKVFNGQSYRMGENWVTYADLDKLLEARERLQREVNQESSGVTLGQMTTFP